MAQILESVVRFRLTKAEKQRLKAYVDSSSSFDSISGFIRHLLKAYI